MGWRNKVGLAAIAIGILGVVAYVALKKPGEAALGAAVLILLLLLLAASLR